MQSGKTLITGGILVDPAQGRHGRFDLLVAAGKIACVSPRLECSNVRVIDAAGKIVLPGFIDLHTHLREPGFEYKETILTGSRAAAAGGFTGITALPNTRPVTDNADTVSFVREAAARAGLVRVWPVGAITLGSAGRELTDMAGLKKAGVVAVSDDGRGVADDRILKKALLLCRRLGLPLLQHCEDESISADGQVHQGAVAERLGLAGLPSAAEEAMLKRDLRLVAETGAALHVMHVSTAGAVELIRSAKQRGLPVTAEVTPHHLLLTDDAVIAYGTMAKMKPPLRTAADREALRKGLVDGTVDAVATDHAPHSEEEKSAGFREAPFGVVGLETAFPLLFTNLVRSGIMTIDQLVTRMSPAPARVLGLPYGTLAPGREADLVIIDPDARKTIDRHRFYSRGKNSPFHGLEVYGLPVLTMVGGRVVMAGGRVTETDEEAEYAGWRL